MAPESGVIVKCARLPLNISNFLFSASIADKLATGRGLVGAKGKMLRGPVYLRDSMTNGWGLQICEGQLKVWGLGGEKGFLYMGLIKV